MIKIYKISFEVEDNFSKSRAFILYSISNKIQKSIETCFKRLSEECCVVFDYSTVVDHNYQTMNILWIRNNS